MVTTITTENVPIKYWSASLDTDTLTQAKNLANLPFVHSHIAIMPDAHVGYGMPIGGVATTKNVVIPHAVGVDIGCGVCGVQTSLGRLEKSLLKKIVPEIRKAIPFGFKHHTKPQARNKMPNVPEGLSEEMMPIVSREFENGRRQLGTLGGGNHFIELQQGDDGYIWLMIHSGSRNIGYQVATYYNQLATRFNKKNGQKVPAKWQLDYLPIDSKQGKSYMREMNFCVEFAASNRKAMMQTVQAILLDFEPAAVFSPPIDIAHNYAAKENHSGQNVIVHRKGATRALSGETGIIPGSQGSNSYIVEGKGSRESFCSCSHGAGRKLGRKQAQRQLDLKTEVNFLEKQGIIHSIRSQKNLDEAAGAYKNIKEVMGNQLDLVTILTTLNPLAVVKG